MEVWEVLKVPPRCPRVRPSFPVAGSREPPTRTHKKKAFAAPPTTGRNEKAARPCSGSRAGYGKEPTRAAHPPGGACSDGRMHVFKFSKVRERQGGASNLEIMTCP